MIFILDISNIIKNSDIKCFDSIILLAYIFFTLADETRTSQVLYTYIAKNVGNFFFFKSRQFLFK